jgi:hypothetical protein
MNLNIPRLSVVSAAVSPFEDAHVQAFYVWCRHAPNAPVDLSFLN